MTDTTSDAGVIQKMILTPNNIIPTRETVTVTFSSSVFRNMVMKMFSRKTNNETLISGLATLTFVRKCVHGINILYTTATGN